jgi:hypothetical protein
MNIQDPVRYKENIHKNVEIKNSANDAFLEYEYSSSEWIDIQTAFYLIGIGTIFGVFILGSEFIFSKCRSGKNSKCNTSFCSKVSE